MFVRFSEMGLNVGGIGEGVRKRDGRGGKEGRGDGEEVRERGSRVLFDIIPHNR